MNTETFTYLLEQPGNIREEHLDGLERVISAYPYFQSARALELKALKDRNSFRYNEALKKTAAYTANRGILFDYITSDVFVQNEISEKIKQHDAETEDIEVAFENVSEQLSVELDNKIKEELKKAEAILNPDLFERKVASVAQLTKQQRDEPSDEVLQPDKPLEFKKEDTHSFGEWLKLTKAVPINRNPEAEPQQEDDKNRKFELIDKFIQERPRILPVSVTAKSEDLSEQFTQTPDTLMTETLARVYVQQKNYKKALQAYNILILKYPEKSGFFADQIRAIKKLINKEEQ